MRRFINNRRKYFVDPKVQGAILRQAGYYWLYGSVIYTLVVFLYRLVPPWLASGDLDFRTVWYHLAPMAVSSAVLFPIVMISAVRFSHRFVGPMIRFRQVLRQLSRGETAPCIELRCNDFWKDVANELNQVSGRLSQVSAGLHEVSAGEPKNADAVSEC